MLCCFFWFGSYRAHWLIGDTGTRSFFFFFLGEQARWLHHPDPFFAVLFLFFPVFFFSRSVPPGCHVFPLFSPHYFIIEPGTFSPTVFFFSGVLGSVPPALPHDQGRFGSFLVSFFFPHMFAAYSNRCVLDVRLSLAFGVRPGVLFLLVIDTGGTGPVRLCFSDLFSPFLEFRRPVLGPTPGLRVLSAHHHRCLPCLSSFFAPICAHL